MLLAEGLFELRGYGMNDWLTHNLYDTIIRPAQEGFPQCMLREGPLIMMANARGKPRFRKSLADRTPPPRPKPPESLTPRQYDEEDAGLERGSAARHRHPEQHAQNPRALALFRLGRKSTIAHRTWLGSAEKQIPPAWETPYAVP